MKLRLLTALLSIACVAQAKEAQFYEKGTLVQMNAVECGVEAKGAEGVGGMLGVDGSQHTKTHKLLCQEYVLRSGRTEYHIRPKEEKHPALLPVGQTAEFRIGKELMRLRVPELDNRERQYIVVSITPIDNDAANSKPAESGVQAH
jgi:hypothetical protein